MNGTNQLINLITEIGEREDCSDVELFTFLPNYPSLKGNELIFTISWTNARAIPSKDIVNFVKGLHQIELKYRKVIKNDFGFGSPSSTAKVINALETDNFALAQELRKWISANGGNYYIRRKKLAD